MGSCCPVSGHDLPCSLCLIFAELCFAQVVCSRRGEFICSRVVECVGGLLDIVLSTLVLFTSGAAGAYRQNKELVELLALDHSIVC
jgi:hypothetical protein